MGARQLDRSDPDLIAAIARGHLDALRNVWDRYANPVHWVCSVHEPDAQLAHGHVVATFLTLWTNPLAALRAPSLPEHLTAIARGVSRTTSPSNPQARATTARFDRLSDEQLTSVALLFSGEFRSDDATKIVGCTQSDLGQSLRTVLTTDARPHGRTRARSR